MEGSKRFRDLEKGRLWREKGFSPLNYHLSGSGMRIRFQHEYHREMTLSEKTANNIIPNRLQENVGSKAMGLDCVVTYSWTDKVVPLILRRFQDFEVYYKAPTLPSQEEVRHFLEHNLAHRHYMLFIDDPERFKVKRYCLFSMKYLVEQGWKVSDSEGNTNRIIFLDRMKRPLIPGNFLGIPILGGNVGLGLFGRQLPLKDALRGLVS